MNRILDNINSPEDLKSLNIKELGELCSQIREYMIDCCSKNPGHLGSSLGAVELAVAIHYVFDNEGFIRHLQGVIQGRHAQMPEGSYTTHLFTKGVNKIAQKVGEEAVETVIEAIDGNRERYLYEASDLIYHLLVLNEQMGFTIADMEAELASRHK